MGHRLSEVIQERLPLKQNIPLGATSRFTKTVPCRENQRIAKGAGGKGPRQKTSKIVKKCQKVFRQFSRRAKNVKNRQKVSKSFSTLFDTFRAAPSFRPLLQSAEKTLEKYTRQNHCSPQNCLRESIIDYSYSFWM